MEGVVKVNNTFGYYPNELLGKGAYGYVYRGINLEKNKQIAVKLIRKKQGIDQNEINILKELSKLTHDHIMGYYGFEETAEGMFIFIEYCPNGTLTNLLSKGGTDEEKVFKLFKEILEGMGYMNAKGQVHRDLKPDNILIGPSNNVKISDFGMAKETTGNLLATCEVGTPLYAAPQVFLAKDKKYTQKCDVWSVGLILYEMLHLKPAFHDLNTMDDLYKRWDEFKHGKMLTYHKKYHPYWSYFTNMMLIYNPEKRYNFKQISDYVRRIQKKMIEEIKLRSINPNVQLTRSIKFKKVENLIQFETAKLGILLDVYKLFYKQDALKEIPLSIKYTLMFLSMTLYLVRVMNISKHIKINQLTLPNQEQPVQPQDDFQLKFLLDNYKICFENYFLENQDKLKTDIIKTLLEDIINKPQETKNIQLISNQIKLADYILKKKSYDLEKNYQNAYHQLLTKPPLSQLFSKITTLNNQQVSICHKLVIIDKIDYILDVKNYMVQEYVKTKIRNLTLSSRNQILNSINNLYKK